MTRQGHNLGAYHSSVMLVGTRGAVAWKDANMALPEEQWWKEYGNPFSVMESCYTVHEMNGNCDFLIEGKVWFH